MIRENGDIDFNDSGKAVDKISKLITHHSASLDDPSVVTAKGKNTRNVYVRLPEDVKTARSHCKVAFESWKNNSDSDGNGINENYRLTLCVRLIFPPTHLEPRRNFRKITKI